MMSVYYPDLLLPTNFGRVRRYYLARRSAAPQDADAVVTVVGSLLRLLTMPLLLCESHRQECYADDLHANERRQYHVDAVVVAH